jgi:hypothetical protein
MLEDASTLKLGNEAAVPPSHQVPSGMQLAQLKHGSSAGSLCSIADVAVAVTSSSSVYDLRSRTARWLILVGVALAALLVPFTGELRFLPGCVLSCATHRAATAWTLRKEAALFKHKQHGIGVPLSLSGVACCMLVSAAADSIYFPALPAVGKDLQASEAAVAATVAVFLFTVGLGNLFW